VWRVEFPVTAELCQRLLHPMYTIVTYGLTLLQSTLRSGQTKLLPLEEQGVHMVLL
jgi:hypothetical protein